MKENAEIPIIKTSEDDWLKRALELLREGVTFILIDDKGIGLNAEDLKSPIGLIKSAKEKADISWYEIVGILAGLGITGVGIWMVAAAIADPEPTSKLGLLIAGGILLALTGSIGTLAFLGIRLSVSLKSPGGGVFEVSPA